MIELLVGLGNPGPDYAHNRHNVGFRVLEALGAAFSRGPGGRFGRARLGGREVALLLPDTYMNRSGLAVAGAMDRLGLALDAVLVVHDELDLAFGTVRLKRGGGAGGHNGLKSIMASCGGPDFDRLRVGIGRPLEGQAPRAPHRDSSVASRPRSSVVDWVLGDFDESEGARLEAVLEDATRALTAAVVDGTDVAMNAVNARERP